MGLSKYFQISSLRSGITNYKDYARQNLTPHRPLFGAVIRTFIDQDYNLNLMQDSGSPVKVLTAYAAAGTTTGLTPVVLQSSGFNIVLAKNRAYSFTVKVFGVTENYNTGYAKEVRGVVCIGATNASAALMAAAVDTVILDKGDGLAAIVSADTTNGALKITVTGAANESIRWIAQVEMLEQ